MPWDGENKRKSDTSRLPDTMVKAYSTAIGAIVQSARKRLEQDTVYKGKTSGMFTKKTTQLDAYYRVMDINGVLHIMSHGSLVETTNMGLFVKIHAKTAEDHLVQLVNIQIPKEPNLVDQNDIQRLSGFFTIEQLQRLDSTIKSAQPMEKEAYEAFMGPFQDMMGVVEF